MLSVKNPKLRDMIGIFELLIRKRQKMNSVHLLQRGKNGQNAGLFMQWLDFMVFGERESTFSLGFRPIGSSVFDGARKKVTLRGEDYAWAPIWWSSENSKR